MAKRFDKFPQKTSNTFKKPRLDVSVVTSQKTSFENSKPSTSCQFLKPYNVTEIKTTTKVNTEVDLNDIWDDDGDEFIVLASQAVDADILSHQIVNLSKIEMSYSSHGNDLRSNSKHTNFQYNTDKQDLFTESEDFDIVGSSGPDQVKKNSNEKRLLVENLLASWDSEDEFLPQPNPNIKQNKTNESNHLNPIIVNLESSTESKTNSLQKENNKIKADFTELCQTLQTKNGEISMLRYEINQLKLKNDSLRLDKMNANESLKKELTEKSREFEKIIQSQKSELDFKNIEILNIKTKKLNDPPIVKQTADSNISIFKTENIKLKDMLYSNKTSSVVFVAQSCLANGCAKIKPEAFIEQAIDESFMNLQDQSLVKLLQYFQSVLSQFNAKKSFDLLNQDEILSNIKRILIYLYLHLKQLNFIKFTDNFSNPKLEYDFLCDQQSRNLNNYESIYTQNHLFANENGILLRRLLAIISIICKYSREISIKLLEDHIGVNKIGKINPPRTPIKLLVHILEFFSYSYDLYDYMGLVTTTSYILNNMMAHFIVMDEQYIDTFYLLFEQIVFCRPTTKCLVKLSSFLYKVKSSPFLNRLCKKCNNDQFRLDNEHKILQFSPDSCALQVYAALVEVTIPQYESLSDIQIKLLFKLTNNIINLFRYAKHNALHWAENTSLPGNNEKSGCNCYIRLSITFVVLFYLCFKHWIESPKSIDLKIISRTVQFAVLLLNDLFFVNNPKQIILIGGSAVIQRLQIIYDWLNEYHTLFSLNCTHEKTLLSMDIKYIISETMKLDDDNKGQYESPDVWKTINTLFFDFKIQ